jgi:hypothetical protein
MADLAAGAQLTSQLITHSESAIGLLTFGNDHYVALQSLAAAAARYPPFWAVSKESVKELLAAHNWII